MFTKHLTNIQDFFIIQIFNVILLLKNEFSRNFKVNIYNNIIFLILGLLMLLLVLQSAQPPPQKGKINTKGPQPSGPLPLPLTEAQLQERLNATISSTPQKSAHRR